MTGCEALAGAALVWCLSRQPGCLPPGTTPQRTAWLAAIADQESGARGPWAVRNETTKRSLWFKTRAEAEREAMARHAEGHTLGLGPMQITHRANWIRFGLADASGRPVYAFDLCRNLRAGALHLAEDHDRQVRLAAVASYNGSGAPARAYALKIEARLPLAVGSAPVPTEASTTCPEAPPSWDVWGSARHAARCERIAARRFATTERGTRP